jgi:hypothetical protein
MEDYISLGKQLGIKDDGHNQVILHIIDIVHNNIEIDYIEYYDYAWVYKEYIDDSCVYHEDETGYTIWER